MAPRSKPRSPPRSPRATNRASGVAGDHAPQAASSRNARDWVHDAPTGRRPTFRHPCCASRRPRARVAVRRGCPRVRAGERWRGHPPHGLGALHHRVAADHGGGAAALGRRLAGSVREVPADPAVPARQPGHEPGGLQAHLLVGVDASLSRAPGRSGLSRAVPVLPGDGPCLARAPAEARRAARPGRTAGRHRLVHGAVGARRAHQRQPIPPGATLGARRTGLCRLAVDGAVARCATARCRRPAPGPAQNCGAGRGASVPADRGRSLRGGPEGRSGLQHLAADGWPIRA